MRRVFVSLGILILVLQQVASQSLGSNITSTIYTQAGEKACLKSIVYDNGLGDIVQEVSVGVTPAKQNLVLQHDYDSNRREIRTWLPIEVSDTKSTNVASLAKLQYSDDYAYTENSYDKIYPNQLASTNAPGKNWNGKKVKITQGGVQDISLTDYANNIAISSNNALQFKRITDEDGNWIEERFNKTGRLMAKVDSNGKTFFLYDYNGNITYVVPPSLSSYLEMKCRQNNIYIFSETDDYVKKYAYIYHYDGMNRCIYKKLPGAEPVYYIYNKAGACILMQDGNLRARGEWQFSIPDAFGRVCVTGTCKNTFTYTAFPLQSTCVYATYDGSSTYKGYKITGLTLSNAVLTSVNYYDNYGFIGKYGTPTTMNYVADASSDYRRDASAGKGHLTGTAVAYMDATGMKGFLYSAVYYDEHHNVVQTRSTNIRGGLDVANCAYTFTGNVKSSKIEHKAGSISKAETYTYTYDHADRLTNVKHSMTGGTEKTIASNTYDRFGRMVSTGHLGISALNTSYTYDIHSNVRSIKTGSAFSEALHYEDSYKANTPKWNGGISSIEWKADATTRGYNYTYDKTDRLTAAKYLEGGTVNDKYSTTYAYDAMGNITSLTRRGKMSNGTYNQIDNLTMTYNGNQLTKVTDAVTSATASGSMDFRDGANVATEYTYDANGNMTSDLNKGITNIQYNFLNLPSKVTFSNGGTVTYFYDATGRKLKVVHAKAGKVHTMEYVGNHIYEDGVLKQTLIEGGYLTYSGNTPAYHFYVKDHLGNNRMVMSASGAVEQVVHYYPYGMAFADGTNADAQRFKYNGKELDAEDGLNWMDYGARMYDAAIGRWGGVDALAEKKAWKSPFIYCSDSPILFFDPDGRDEKQREEALAKAREYVEANPNNDLYEYGAKGGPGEPVDCSGLVSACVVAGGESDPAQGTSNGCSNIANNTTHVGLSGAVEGNIILFSNDGVRPNHAGMITNIIRNESGGITKMEMIDSGGKVGPRDRTIIGGTSNYWENIIYGVYKWDSRPDPVNATSVNQAVTTAVSTVDKPSSTNNIISLNKLWEKLCSNVSSILPSFPY
ncbi:MAG: RHS repeat-associated core domain-containing protein [Bacteroidales bacterium]|nr:RHS repeat-associated core domain-containing protein [Bacteroidales bacterium]